MSLKEEPVRLFDCMICNSKCVCDSKHTIYSSCKHICWGCRKKIRATIKAHGNSLEKLKDYKCNHPETCRMPNRQSFILDLQSSIDACVFCAEEIRKECTLIKTKVRKQQKINTLATESLSDKCIKVIVNDPGLLLVASTQYQFPDETVWKRMNELAPAKLTPAFKAALEESKEANGVWM